MASLTTLGTNTTLSGVERGENFTVALSGTYAMTVSLQRELASPGSGAWETLKKWSTANATVSELWLNYHDNARYRLIAGPVTSGTCVATLTFSYDRIQSSVVGGDVETLPNVLDFNMDVSSNSSSTSTSIEPFNYTMTMEGAGSVGGRAAFRMDTNVALGSWSNALKAEVTYGASGRTTGLGSAFVAEMTLSAGTSQGNYAPLELEVNMPSGALTGTKSAFLHLSSQGADVATWDANAGLFNLYTVIGSGGIVQTSASAAVDSTHSLRVFINGVTYYIPMNTAQGFGG